MKKIISIIVPVLNEEENILTFFAEVTNIINSIKKYDFEIIFTDNHSQDNSFDIIKSLHKADARVTAYRFSKNIGYQHSILTGYKKASGDAVIQIDCDLQDPPSLIPKFIKLWEQGNFVVYGVRVSRKEGKSINFFRKVFYRLINWLREEVLPVDAGDFRLVDRKIVNRLIKRKNAQPYLRGELSTMGFKQIGVDYNRVARKEGESKFNVLSLISLAVDGIVSHSIKPLRLSLLFSAIIAFISIVGVVVYSVGKLTYVAEWPPGYATIVVLLFIGIAVNALFLGVLGEYVGRIYKQVKFIDELYIEESLKKPIIMEAKYTSYK